MMTISPWTWLVLSCFALLTILHALSLRRKIRWSFRSHCMVMGSLWFLWNVSLVVLVVVLPPTISLSSGSRVLGVILVLLGLALSTWHRLLLGRKRFLGGRCFDTQYDTRTTGGLYRYLRNPIYDGIIFAFLGLALWRENTDFLILGLATFLFLNVFMARVEGAPPLHPA